MYSVPASRYRRAFQGRLYIKVIGILFLLSYCLIKIIPAIFTAYPSAAGAIKELPGRVLESYRAEPLQIIKAALPILRWSSFEGDGAVPSVTEAFLSCAGVVGRVNLLSPAAVLQSQIPLLAAVEYPDSAIVTGPGLDVGGGNEVPALTGESLVCIYNTHTGETYSLTDGVERLDGRHGGVVTVAAAMQETLESSYGIKVARSDKINDTDYNLSYLESEKTARELLSANPKAGVVFDIHRDSGKTREQSVVNIDGQTLAPVLFIVGSDARRPFPAWRQNYAFAVDLSDRINEKYPGLSLGVRVKDGLYNQSLHPRAVLLEVGTTENSCEEAVRSARLIAGVVADVLVGE
ncbi:stage II sporulation protein P [Pelotomaculum propionicicum]|uniref:stage II sporulation protein P n=1 Tax=Pelotomaculum propionicicum TaxID=258475 RepID=UPI003B7A31A4